MLKKFLFITLVLFTNIFNNIQVSLSQDIIIYTYDDSGNRTGRYLELGAMLRSAYLEEDISEKYKQDTLRDLTIHLLPNPTDGFVNIYINKEISEEIYFSLYDMSGNLLIEKRYQGVTKEIDLNNLTSGTYLFNIRIADKSVIRKVIKK